MFILDGEHDEEILTFDVPDDALERGSCSFRRTSRDDRILHSLVSLQPAFVVGQARKSDYSPLPAATDNRGAGRLRFGAAPTTGPG